MPLSAIHCVCVPLGPFSTSMYISAAFSLHTAADHQYTAGGLGLPTQTCPEKAAACSHWPGNLKGGSALFSLSQLQHCDLRTACSKHIHYYIISSSLYLSHQMQASGAAEEAACSARNGFKVKKDIRLLWQALTNVFHLCSQVSRGHTRRHRQWLSRCEPPSLGLPHTDQNLNPFHTRIRQG